LRAELDENMRCFLSLLLVCKQTYEEARLFPFLCNVFEFDSCGKLLNAMTEEHRHTIQCLFLELGRKVSDRPILAQDFPSLLEQFTGLKAVVRKSPLHPADWNATGRLAEERNCKIVEEDIIPPEGVYKTTYPTRYPEQREPII
jgi:hypothetical protein